MKALVLEDRDAHVLVIAAAGFLVPPRLADVTAAQLINVLEAERGGILLYSAGAGAPAARDIVSAVTAAAQHLEPVALRAGGERVSVVAPDGTCRASFFPLAFENCASGSAVHPPIRAAYRALEAAPRLQSREEDPPAITGVQAIAIGRQVTITVEGGDPPRFGVLHSRDPRIQAALETLLRRIGR